MTSPGETTAVVDQPLIDAHTHVDLTSTAGLRDAPEALLAELDRWGVSAAVCTAYAELDEVGLRTWAASVAPQRHRLWPLGRIDPRSPVAVDLVDLAVGDLGMVGVKLHPASTGVAVDDPRSVAVLERAGALGVPVLVHAGPQEPCRPERVVAAAAAAPGTVVLVGHVGGPALAASAVRAASRVPNAWVETSTVADPAVVAGAVRAMPGRVVWGSDGPRGHVAASLAVVRRAGLSPAEAGDVLGGAVARLLGVAAPPVRTPGTGAGSGVLGDPLPGEWDVPLGALRRAGVRVVVGVPDPGVLDGAADPVVVAGGTGEVSGQEVAALSALVERDPRVHVLSAGWYRADALRSWALAGRLAYASLGGDPVVERTRVAALDLPPAVLADVAGGLARRLVAPLSNSGSS